MKLAKISTSFPQYILALKCSGNRAREMGAQPVTHHFAKAPRFTCVRGSLFSAIQLPCSAAWLDWGSGVWAEVRSGRELGGCRS